MKNKNWLILALTAVMVVPALAKANPPAKGRHMTKRSSSPKSAEASASPSPSPVAVASPSPSPSATPAPVEVVREVSKDEFNSLGLGLSLTNGTIQVTGSLSAPCAERLSIKDLKEALPSADDAASKPATLADLSKHAKFVGVRLSFKGDNATDGLQSLQACEEKFCEKSDRTDLSTRSSLGRSLSPGNTIAVAGLLDSQNAVIPVSPAVLSPDYKSLIALIDAKDCKTCNTVEGVKTRVDQLSSLGFSWLSDVELQLVTNGITQELDAAKNAKSIEELSKISADLGTHATRAALLSLDPAQKAALLTAIGKGYDALIERNSKMAAEEKSSCAQKTTERTFFAVNSCNSEAAHADLASSVYSKIASLPGLDAGSADQARKLSAGFAVGGTERLDFISNLNPAHDEVRSALAQGQIHLQGLAKNAQKSCFFVRNQESFLACNQARAEYSAAAQSYQNLSQKFASAQYLAQAMAGQQQSFQGFSQAGVMQRGAPMNAPFLSYPPQSGQLQYGQNAYNPQGFSGMETPRPWTPGSMQMNGSSSSNYSMPVANPAYYQQNWMSQGAPNAQTQFPVPFQG